MKNSNSTTARKAAALLFSSLLALFPGLGRAATVTVQIVGDSFNPSTVTINVGDTVTWSGLGGAHNVTGTTANDLNDFCGSSLSSTATETSCSHTFDTAGTFPYECTIHAQCCNMKGMVIVNAAAPSPTVTITNPPAGAVFSAPATLKLGAAAAVSGGTVTNVAFFASTVGAPVALGTAKTSPFDLTGSSLGAGNYALTAVATAGGISTTSAVVNVSIVMAAALSNSVPLINAQHFSFAYSATIGLTYVVQRTSDLITWTPVSTNVAASSSPLFSDSAVVGAANYYRVVLQSNP